MAFNGQGRYGYVPPAQYGPPGTQQNHGLQRRPSFDNGDDGAVVNQNNYSRYPGAPPANSRVPSMPQEEHYTSAASPMRSPQSPGVSTFGNSGPALAGYQHSYQPYSSDSQSAPPPQVTYNPQHFARSQSTTQPPSQYRPYPAATAYSNNTTRLPQVYDGLFRHMLQRRA